MAGLDDIDFEILKFIRMNEPVDIKALEVKFPEVDSLEYRLKIMAKQKYDQMCRAPLPNSSLILQQYETAGKGINETAKPLGIYKMTDFGRKSLQDYIRKSQIYKKELWLKNAWIPILVSIATNLVINVLKPLWPLIQQWVSSFL